MSESKFSLKAASSYWDNLFEGKLKKDPCLHFVFYGGSFNPWHKGHSSCVELLKNFDAEEELQLIIIPDLNPWKNQNNFTDQKKLEIYKKVIKNVSKQEVYPGFLLKNQKNPSYEWIKSLATNYPLSQFSLLMGFDNFSNFHKWYKYEKLANLLTALFIVSREDDIHIKEAQAQHLSKMAPKLDLHFLGSHKFENLSSSKIRRSIV